jgi:hypothetical protein
MKVNPRQRQRNPARMKAKAVADKTTTVLSKGQHFACEAAKPKTWQGAAKGKGKINGDRFSTGLKWESSQ